MNPVLAEFKPNKPPSAWHWTLAVVSLVLASVAWLDVYQLLQTRVAAEASFARERAAQSSQVPAVAASPAARPYERSAREMLAERQHPWPLVLRALEVTALPGVVVKSFDVQKEGAGVGVEVAVESHAQLLEYLAALSAGEDQGADGLVWVIQQTQLDPATGTHLAMLKARRK